MIERNRELMRLPDTPTWLKHSYQRQFVNVVAGLKKQPVVHRARSTACSPQTSKGSLYIIWFPVCLYVVYVILPNTPLRTGFTIFSHIWWWRTPRTGILFRPTSKEHVRNLEVLDHFRATRERNWKEHPAKYFGCFQRHVEGMLLFWKTLLTRKLAG